MAKYSKKTSNIVREEIEEMKAGKLTIGKSDIKVTNPKQAIAIGLSEARAAGEKVPNAQETVTSNKKTATKKVAVSKASLRKSKKKATAKK